MPRLPRSVLPDVCDLHVFSRAIRREPLFGTERDGFAFLFRSGIAFDRYDVSCQAYCLMPTHFHFVTSGPRVELSRAMQWLIGGYAAWFNREYAHRGHLVGGRYGSRLVEDDADKLRVARYVVANPVVAGLCAHPREWRWSSYRAMTGIEAAPAFLELDWLDASVGPDGFAEFVDEGLAAARELGTLEV